jgi:hypothetical protein
VSDGNKSGDADTPITRASLGISLGSLSISFVCTWCYQIDVDGSKQHSASLLHQWHLANRIHATNSSMIVNGLPRDLFAKAANDQIANYLH